MSVDPKKGGKCWSCKYCEDIATQTDNPSGSYYRKCNKSGHEYIDTCRFYCGDYIWDGKTEQNASPSSSSSSSSTKSTASSSSYSSASSSYNATPSTSSYSTPHKKNKWLPWVLLLILLGSYAIYYAIFFVKPNSATDSGSETTLSTEPTYPVAYVNISDTLNLRIGPGQSYDLITAMPNGAEVYVVETKSGWSYVIYENQRGWCSAQYLAAEK